MVDLNVFLKEILIQAQNQSNNYWIKKLLYTDYNRAHLAIMVEPYLSLLLQGKKTIESRFSQKRMMPFHQVNKGDIIILKKSGGAIVGAFEALETYFFEPKSESDMLTIKAEYNQRLCGSDEFWMNKMNSHYATLIEVGNLLKLTPIKVSFKNRRAWIVGSDLQECPTVLCVSGEIASGKTYIAKKLAEVLSCDRYSVSDFLKMLAVKQGQKNISREVLQELGREQINNGWKTFCKDFLDFTKWDNKGFLIIDGIRHAEFLQSLSDLVRPWGRVVSIFVEADTMVRNERLEIRGEVIGDSKHVAEGNLLILKENSDIIVLNNESDSDTTVANTVSLIFDIQLREVSYGLFR